MDWNMFSSYYDFTQPGHVFFGWPFWKYLHHFNDGCRCNLHLPAVAEFQVFAVSTASKMVLFVAHADTRARESNHRVFRWGLHIEGNTGSCFLGNPPSIGAAWGHAYLPGHPKGSQQIHSLLLRTFGVEEELSMLLSVEIYIELLSSLHPRRSHFQKVWPQPCTHSSAQAVPRKPKDYNFRHYFARRAREDFRAARLANVAFRDKF